MQRKLITVLLSAALIWSIQQNTPVHKSFADHAKAKPVQVATPEKVAEVTQTPTEQEPVNEPASPQEVTPVAPPATYNGTGDPNLDYIVQHESSGNPFAINSIGACGLFQALPCSKLGCDLSDIQCQIDWGRQYAVNRYGSTYQAMLFWQSNRWW
jgi:hypothetical protein